MRWQKAWVLSALLIVGIVWWVKRGAAGLKEAADPIPTARVREGTVRLNVHTTGELETGQIATLVAPPVGGGTLQIVRLDPTGTVVRKGDIVLQFDPSEQEYNVENNQSTLEEAEQEIAQAKAQADVQNSDDRLALLKAQFAVRQAELQVQENPILAAIDAKKNLLALAEAKRSLAELQQDIQSHAASNQAALELAETKYAKARVEMERAERNIHNMTLRSPIAGVVKVEENRMAAGGVFFNGMTLPEFRAGDQAQPGTPIVQILDLSHMTIATHIPERDRPLVSVSEPVKILVDAMPGVILRGHIETISGMALRPLFSPNPNRRFDVTVALDRPDPSLHPGFSAHLILEGRRLGGTLYIPRVAVFGEPGKPYVYVGRGGKFERQTVSVLEETSTWAVIEGLQKGMAVALVSPRGRGHVADGGASGPSVAGGGATP